MGAFGFGPRAAAAPASEVSFRMSVDGAGGDFQEIIAREVDKLKESLLASFAEKFPARTVNAFKTAGHSDADTSSRGGFCCAARDASRGGTLALPAPKPGSSWKPIATEPTEMETSEVNNLAAERESTFVSSVGEADSKEYRAVCRWSEMTRAVMDGVLAARRKYSMPDEYFSIHPNWTRGEQTVRSRTVVAPKMVTTHQGMRVKSQMLDESSRLQKYVSHPDHLVRMMWLCTGMLLIFWDLITIPLVLADATEDTQNFLVLVSHCTVWYWIVDLFYNFFTGYDTGAGIEMRPAKIARHYIRTWLLPDTALVLIEVVIKLLEIIAATDSEELSSVKVLRAVRILRFLRLLRLQKISRIIEVIAKHFTSLTFWLTVKIASGLVFILVVNHYLAIFFMAIGSRGVKNGGPNWLDTYTDEDYGFWDTYAISLHWSLTQFTPSTNNVGPISVPERLFAIAVVLVALALFSSFLSSITNAVNALRSVRLSSASQEAQIRQFFHERNLPAALLAQVKAFMRVRVAAISRMREKDVKLLLELPEALKRRLHTEMYLVHVMELPWWPAFISSRSDFVEKVCHRATTEMLGSPGGDIFVPDGKCEGAIVPVDHGLVYTHREVFNKHSHRFFEGDAGVVSLRPYQPLADVGLWAVWKYRGHLSAEATCPYLFISAEEFSEVAINFGGSTFRYLQVFGLLYVSHVEDLIDRGQLSDLGVDLEVIDDLKARAEFFMEASRASSAKFVTMMAMQDTE